MNPYELRHKILVVDDNIDSATLLGTLMEMWGHEVQIAHSGKEAIDTAAAFSPELIFLDIGLPGLDGYQVARHLRSEGSFDECVLAALTGYGADDDKARAYDAGFDHYFVKPVDPQALENFIQEDFLTIRKKRSVNSLREDSGTRIEVSRD